MTSEPGTTRHEHGEHVITVTTLGEPEIPGPDEHCGDCQGRADVAFTFALSYRGRPGSVSRVAICFGCAARDEQQP